jgi:outer membrane protein TolC
VGRVSFWPIASVVGPIFVRCNGHCNMRSSLSRSVVVWSLLLCVFVSGCRGRRVFVRNSGDAETPAYVPEIPTAQKSRKRMMDRLSGSGSRQSDEISADSGVSGVEPAAVQAEPVPSDRSLKPSTPDIALTGFSAGPAEVSTADSTDSSRSAVSTDPALPAAVEVPAAAEVPAELPSLSLQQVIDSVYRSYPMLQAALLTRNIAAGQQTGALGAFDTKLKGASENGPIGFYETYRQSVGVVKPTYWGGEVFGGYRIGRGEMQPWYGERVTDDGGEFKAGIQLPLARNRTIDDRRAELWKAGLERQLAEPDIQAQLIDFVRSGSYAWWDWVAAGEYHRIATHILELAEDRTERVRSQVDAGFTDPPELTDNLRLVAIRQAKVADTRRKLQQTAAKLSIYLRDASGRPVVPGESQLPRFPALSEEPIQDLSVGVESALARRPELKLLDLVRRQVQIDYSNASNYMQPELNAVLWGSQDVGAPASRKGDKSDLEAEASLLLDVPVERRKARGKMSETQAKLSQLTAKRRLTVDKITVDVQVAHAALVSAREQVQETAEAMKLAEDLAERERQNEEAGLSDMLKVALREQYAVESAEKNVDALQLYFQAMADFRAAVAEDRLAQ